MNLLFEIKNWLVRTFIVLFGFSFFIIPSISISANPINYENDYRSYSSIDLKIAKETNAATNRHLKDAVVEVCFTCKSESDLVA